MWWKHFQGDRPSRLQAERDVGVLFEVDDFLEAADGQLIVDFILCSFDHLSVAAMNIDPTIPLLDAVEALAAAEISKDLRWRIDDVGWLSEMLAETRAARADPT